MTQWLVGHTLGWQAYLSGLLLLVLGARLLLARHNEKLVPYLWLAAWLLTALLIYIVTGMHASRSSPRYAFILLTVAILAVPPLVIATVVLMVPKREAAPALRVQAAALVAGLASIPAMPYLAGLLAQLFFPAR